eukprot:RCo008520
MMPCAANALPKASMLGVANPPKETGMSPSASPATSAGPPFAMLTTCRDLSPCPSIASSTESPNQGFAGVPENRFTRLGSGMDIFDDAQGKAAPQVHVPVPQDFTT